MTERRRNVFVLLFVALLIVASGVAIVSQPTRLGLDLKGGVSLVYEVQGTQGQVPTDDQIQRTISVITQRVNELGTTEAEIQRSGERQIDVSIPEITDASQAEETVGTTAQLAFYDWEPNVVGPGGRIDPQDTTASGGGGAGSQSAGIAKFDAVQRAAKLPRETRGALVGDQWFAVVPGRKRVIGDPESTRERLVAAIADDGQYRAVRGADGGLRDGAELVRVPAGFRIVQAQSDNPTADPDSWYVLRDRPLLTGDDIRDPEVGRGDRGQGPSVDFKFDEKGRELWPQITRRIAQFGQDRYVPQAGNQQGAVSAAAGHFAIALDDRLISVPQIDFLQYPDGIDARNGSSISGGFTQQTANQLASLLRTGSLPVRLDLISQSQVSASLGAESLDQALKAGIAGFLIVAAFLILFYRVLGVVAVGAIVVYGVFTGALVNLIPIVMTLPGIAGLILTIGVAADANIVIFERVKEEVRKGRSVPRALREGYRKGLTAIIDANVVTFLVAFVLFLLTQAGVRGFALTLGVGVLVSFFTAVVLTQAVLLSVGRSRFVTHPAAFGGTTATSKPPPWHRFDFVGASRFFFAMSGVILIVGAVAIGTRGVPLGIDFESGTRVTAVARAGSNEDQVRAAMARAGFGDAKIQRISTAGGGPGVTFQVATEALDRPQIDRVSQALEQGVGVAPTAFNTETIGPTFGATVARSAVLAVLFSLVLIGAVIWLRFGIKYTVPILIALAHDLLIVAGVYSLAGREVSAATVSALLTILGYSLYDTIIVFDRIRENVKKMPSAAYSQIVNRSMSEVLVRSLATSFSTALPILMLLVFGGETLKDFAFALLVGTVSGAYSSVFIAGQVLNHWMERERKWTFRRVRIAHHNGGMVPAYADGNAAVEVASTPKARRALTDDDPAQGVGRDEFDRMVDELGLEDHPGARGGGTETATKPRRGRRGSSTRQADAPPAVPEAEDQPVVDRSADATPEDLILDDDRKSAPKKRRQPRNRRHGRPR